MAPQKDAGSDFASVMGRAMEPPAQGDSHGRDLPDGFPLPVQPHHRVVDSAKDAQGIDGLVAYDFRVHRQVFTIYRPWESCARCQNNIASNQVALPDEGDYDCPHHNAAAYKEIVDKCLAGLLMFGAEQEIVQNNGTVSVSLRWYEKTLNRKKARAAARAAAKEQGVPFTDISGQKEEQDL